VAVDLEFWCFQTVVMMVLVRYALIMIWAIIGVEKSTALQIKNISTY